MLKTKAILLATDSGQAEKGTVHTEYLGASLQQAFIGQAGKGQD